LAAREQGKYEEMHWAIMSTRRANKNTVLKAAAELGLDLEKLQSDMQSSDIDEHIELSMRLANSIGFSGTPSFVIGDQIVPGAVSLDRMRELVETARKSSNKDD
jgi:protein-disulfide isomerase